MATTDVVKLTKDLVDIKSESEIDGEKEVSKYTKDYLADIGIASEITEFAKGRCSVSASTGSGEGLMLNGHIDTVPIGNVRLWKYGINAKEANGKLYGRGTSDMKGGVAAILAAIPSVKLSNAKRRLVFTFVADEEQNFRGSEWLIKNRRNLFKNVKYGIIAEPTDMGLQIAQKGITHFKIIAKGVSAHGSMPNLGKNAIMEMAKFLSALEKLPKNLKTKDKLLGKGTINVGKITGGTVTNVVPDYCEVKIDRRLVPGETEKTAAQEIKRVLDSTGIDYSMENYLSRPPFKLSESSYLVKFLSKIIPANYIGATGYTEAELYKSLAKIDCVVFGPGTKAIIHKPNEYVLVSNLIKSQKYYAKVMQKWCTA